MNKQQKAIVIQSLREQFGKSTGSFLVNIKGLTVYETQKLRSGLREQGGVLKVAKVSLVRLALNDAPVSNDLAPYLKEQLGVVFAYQDTLAVAQVLSKFAKEHAAMNLVAGCLDSQVLDKASVVRIASLPSRSVLLAQLCGVLNANTVKLVLALKEVEKQKSSQG